MLSLKIARLTVCSAIYECVCMCVIQVCQQQLFLLVKHRLSSIFGSLSIQTIQSESIFLDRQICIGCLCCFMLMFQENC